MKVKCGFIKFILNFLSHSFWFQATKEKVVLTDNVSFREKFFNHAEESRQMKRKKKMENYQNYQMKLLAQENEHR